MRRHIPRWVHASIKNYIKGAFQNVPIFIEGETDKKPDAPFFIELRIDGPSMDRSGTRSEYWGDVQINLLITCNKDEKYVNILQDKMGLCWEALDNCIPIKRAGSRDPIDNLSAVTVLQLIDHPFEINNFGQVDQNIRIQQAAVEAHYRFQITLEDD
jgi:hypothetical protein